METGTALWRLPWQRGQRHEARHALSRGFGGYVKGGGLGGRAPLRVWRIAIGREVVMGSLVG